MNDTVMGGVSRRARRVTAVCLIGNAVFMNRPQTASSRQVVRLIGIYDADSTFRGELAYWVGARLGKRHCALCDITHGSVRQRPEWKACKAEMPVPFDTFHRNDQPEPIRATSGGRAPVVIAQTDVGFVVLLTNEELEKCQGSADRLVEAIETSARTLSLTWPAS